MWLCVRKFKNMLTNLLQSTNASNNESHTTPAQSTGRSGSARMSLQRPNSLPLGDNYNRRNNNTNIPRKVDKQTSTMNTLSSNSSEEEVLSSHHALYIVKGTFLKDFDLRDVHLHDLFTEYELKYINAGDHGGDDHQAPQILSIAMQDANREEQVSRLFAVLRHKDPAKIRKFMDTLLMDHDWLVHHFENVSKIDYSSYVDLVHALHSKVHLKYDDYNVHRSMPFRKLRNALLNMPPDGRVVLASDFGCGKKWLAIDACADFDVAKAMNFQIHWIDMSQCTSSLEDLRMLRYLKLLLTESARSPSPASYGSLDRAEQNTHAYRNSIAEIKQAVSVELKRAQNRKCLVVLVNVQNTHALTAFDLPCKLLVITRSKKVSDSFARSRSTVVRLKRGLTREEVYILFEKYLEQQSFSECEVDMIYTHSNGHPYLLSLIGQSLRQKSSTWQSWIDKLRESDLVDEKFNAAIEKSLESLEPVLRKTFLKVFRCFPHAIFVPKEVIAALWPERKCEKDLEKLHRHGFLEKFTTPHGDICYKLPFIYGKLKEKLEADEADMVEMHKQLLNYYHFAEDLEARKDVLPFKRDIHDFYFFLCIGYHLKKSRLTAYFRQLYLDYGFLEQKMRTVDLLSTIADLETFRHFIAPDSERRKVFRAIREFLPNIEKTLQESENATLLQCALMESGWVGREARTQAAAFPDYTWFEQRGCYHQRHNIIPLPCAPRKVILLDHERSLIALTQSKTICLLNTSLNWNSYAVKLKDPMQVKTKVIDIRFFNDCNSDILLALFDNGDMKVWCIPGECSADRRRSDSFVRPQEKEIECSNVIPRIYSFKPISAFDLSCSSFNAKSPILYMAHKTGEINHIQWKSETRTFESASIPPLKTDMQNICIVRLVFHRNYIVGTNTGDVRIFEARDYSHPRGLEPFRHFIEAIELSRNEQLLVCRRCIVRFTSKSINQTGPVEYLLHESDLTVEEKCNAINCAKLLLINGRKQLVLGTNSGLIIFDIETRTKVLATNVNEEIICVDVQPLDNIKYKYMVACGARDRKYLNLFALRVDANGGTLLEWSHRATSSRTERDRGAVDMIDLEMAPDVWLKGGKLFAVQYVEGDEFTLLAVDSQNQLHKIDVNGHIKLMQLPYTITAITLYGMQAVIGCANGQLFDLTAPAPLITAAFKDEAIEFLQMLDEQTLIAASATELEIFTNFSNNNSSGEQQQQQQFQLNCGKVKRCFRLMHERFVIVFESRFFWILNDSAVVLYKYDPKRATLLGDCDLQNNQLFIVSANYRIEVFDLNEPLAPSEPKIVHYGTADISSQKKVSCIAASRNASLLAVAWYDYEANGEVDVSIDVYECADRRVEFLYHLNGHHRPINAMRFSPNAHVLVSCAEQMCWWSMQMATCKLNNTLTETAPSPKTNSRFETSYSSESTEESEDETVDSTLALARRAPPTHIFEELSLLPHKDRRPAADITPIDGVACDMHRGGVGGACGDGACAGVATTALDAIWKTKRGPDAHCELLSCIKFSGSEAQQFFANEAFTQFQTIDNGGGYYVLTLRDYSAEDSMALASPLHKSFTIPVPYKAELSIDETEYGEGGVDVVT